MVIFEFDVDESLTRIEQNYDYVNEIKNSLAEKRSEYRRFANIINLDFNALDKCCSNYEYTLLIDMYTFSERLMKNFFYEMIDFETYTNQSLNTFVGSKVPKERFSPNVKYSEIEKTIRDQLITGFKFILSNNKAEISMYNEMVKSRHVYAHRGLYSFSLNNFTEILSIQKYLYSELKMILSKGCDYRLQFQTDYFDLKTMIQRTKINQSNLKHKGNELRNIKEKCKRFYSLHGSSLHEMEIMRSIAEKIEIVSKVDLRSKNSSFQAIVQLKDSF